MGDHVGVVGSVCWSWKRLRARAGEVKNSCRFFGSDLPSGPAATYTGTRTKLRITLLVNLVKLGVAPKKLLPKFDTGTAPILPYSTTVLLHVINLLF